MTTVEITDDNFETLVTKSDQPVVLDFWASWCGPCKQMAPALEELSEVLAGRVVIAKLNIDDNPNVPTKYGVRGVPTMMVFKDGQVIATKVGAMTKTLISAWVDDILLDEEKTRGES